ncbi:MAG TPA: DUF2971 domain-containing protein [Nitrospira sp.]|nr:DUF2971 domain-containing protein [Nitrospira sp.]
MHYTTADGLNGIVSSKTLWATHAGFLNDSEEVIGFFSNRLGMILKPELQRHVPESLEQCLAEFLAAFRKAQEQTQDHYVTSFCTACDEWVSQNGLLSQWRGYGQDGGYAIVFDTKGLDSLLRNDAGHYHDSEETLVFGDVQYDEGVEGLSFVRDKQILNHLQSVRDSFAECLKGEGPWEDYKAFDSVAVLSTFWKHRGFNEEREVRIVIGEPSPKTQRELANEVTTPFRKIYAFARDGIAVPCIHLFEDQELETLPIRRIIVGPHLDKEKRRKAVEILLKNHGIDADVMVSATPFRGR